VRIKFLTGRLVKIDLSKWNQRYYKAEARRAMSISVPPVFTFYTPVHVFQAKVCAPTRRGDMSCARIYKRRARTWNGQIYMENDRRYKVVMSRVP